MSGKKFVIQHFTPYERLIYFTGSFPKETKESMRYYGCWLILNSEFPIEYKDSAQKYIQKVISNRELPFEWELNEKSIDIARDLVFLPRPSIPSQRHFAVHGWTNGGFASGPPVRNRPHYAT